MSDDWNSGEKGNSSTKAVSEDFRRFVEETRKLRGDATELAAIFRQARKDCEDLLRERLRQHPYVGLATAAGVGYVLGAGISPSLIRIAAVVGGRIVMSGLAREAVAPLTEALATRIREARTQVGRGSADWDAAS